MTPFLSHRRDRGGPDPHLGWKSLLFAVGAAFAVVGIATENTLLTGAAIALLALGLVLRLAARRGREAEVWGEDESEEEEWEAEPAECEGNDAPAADGAEDAPDPR
jgi:hypothetical protein